MSGSLGLGIDLSLSGKVAAAAPSLSVEITPSSYAWSGGSGGWFSAGLFTATASNVTGSPTYLWEFVSDPTGVSYFGNGGDVVQELPSNDGVSNPGTVTLRCTVTDSLGFAISNTVTVS